MRTPLVAAACLAAFGAWLALPRSLDGGAPRAVCLVDVSASVRRTRPDFPRWVGARLEAFARDAVRAGADVRVLAFADGRRELVAACSARELEARLAEEPLDPVPRGMDGLSSDLAAALLDAEGWLAGGSGGRLVVLGDGEVGDDPRGAASALLRLAARGVACVLEEPPPPSRPDVRIERLEVPSDSDSGAPLLVRVESAHVAADGSTAPLVVELYEPGASVPLAVHTSQIVFSGPAPVRASAELPPPADGLWLVRARIGAGGDAAPENDAREALVRVGGALSGVVVAREADRSRAHRLASAFEVGVTGSHWSVVEPDGLAALVDALDVACALDVPPADLPVASLAPLLASGGGLLVLGGPALHVSSTRGPGVDLLPLVATPPGNRPRDVVLMLDGSGSMAGEPFAAVRSAARDLLRATPPGDGLQVVVFTSGLLPSPLDVRGDEVLDERAMRAAEEWLAELEAPGGNTSIVYSLEQWLRERAQRRVVDGERRAVVIMLTDGQENEDTPNVAARRDALRSELERQDAALYTVAIGARIDREFLEALVPAPERRLEPAPADLRRAVADAAAAERVLKGPLRVRTPQAGRDVGLPAVPTPWNAASRATLREGASALCLGPADEPLAALWPVAGGRVASFAGGTDWIPDLLERPQRFAGLLRHLAANREHSGVRLVRDDDGLLLVGLSAPAERLVGLLTVGGRPPRSVPFDAEPAGWRAPAQALGELERSALGGLLELEGHGRWPVPARAPRELRGSPRLAFPTHVGTPPPSERRGHPAATWVLALAGALACVGALPLPGARRREVKGGAQALR